MYLSSTIVVVMIWYICLMHLGKSVFPALEFLSNERIGQSVKLQIEHN